MTTVADLGLAPGKSMRAYEDVPELHIDGNGLVVGDRAYMWVEAGTHVYQNYKKGHEAGSGHFVSQREDPVLTGIIPVLQPDGGVLLQFRDEGDALSVPRAQDTADNRRPVSVHGWRGEAVDQGNEAAEWGRERIGRSVRLVAVSGQKPRYVEGDPVLGKVGFADGHPVTVGSVESLKLVNAELTAKGLPAISEKRARMTIMLAGLELPELTDPTEVIFPEDFIETIIIASNGLAVVLRRTKACSRCPIPDTDQISGERKGRPVLSALGRLGRAGRHRDEARYGTDSELFWTQGFIVELPEGMPKDETVTIARGAEVAVTYSSTTNWVPRQHKTRTTV